MNARKRSQKNKQFDGIPNLYPNGKYFKYCNPISGKCVSWNCSADKAISTAKELNELFRDAITQKLIDKVLKRSSKSITVKDVIHNFRLEYMPDKNWSSAYISNIEFKLSKYERDLGLNRFIDMTVIELNDYFKQFKTSAYIKHRELWSHLFRFAIAKGVMPVGQNNAEATLRKTEPKRKRQRIKTYDQFVAIYNAAPVWLQRAMKFSLISLQPRQIVCDVKFSDYKKYDKPLLTKHGMQYGKLRVVRTKSNDHLEINVYKPLHDLIVECRKTEIPSNYIIHRRPGRKNHRKFKGQVEWTQINPDFLTDEFKKAVEKSGVYSDYPRDEWAVFHEIRSFGGIIYEKMGVERQQINDLRGHESDTMRKLYNKDQDFTEWKECHANMDINDIENILRSA